MAGDEQAAAVGVYEGVCRMVGGRSQAVQRGVPDVTYALLIGDVRKRLDELVKPAKNQLAMFE